MEKPFQLTNSQFLYLMGSSSSPFLKRCRFLMETCAQYGEFLSLEKNREWLSCYEQDAQHLHTKLPLLVFRPHTIADIAPFVHACYEINFSVIPRCGGTGLVGSCVPSRESVVLLTAHLKRMHNYEAKKGTISLEAGVTIRQLNQYVKADGWHFPLKMATEGVAGIAGCLSCQARGYHQQQQAILDAINRVTLVDGQGQVIEAPGSLVSGAEGLWGIIIEVHLQLKHQPFQSKRFIYKSSWGNMLSKLPLLRTLQTLTSIWWSQDQFYLELEGEEWRLPSATAFLTQVLSEVQPDLISSNPPSFSCLPSSKPFIIVSSVFSFLQLPEACQWAVEKAEHLQLKCLQQADVLAGSLQLTLHSKEGFYSFAQKIECFMVLWTDFLDRQQAKLASCHGVGLSMRSYMPPFWTEETQRHWKKLQQLFDPKKLFSQEHFFPVTGKSLEKVRKE